MKKVFEPVSLRHLSVKNRLIRSATWEGIANPDGSITEETYTIYKELARGGVGTILTGFTSVALHDHCFDGMMRLCDDALIPQYQELAQAIHAEGCAVITQLALGAFYREADGRYQQAEPDDMTEEEIHLVTGMRQRLSMSILPMSPACHEVPQATMMMRRALTSFSR